MPYQRYRQRGPEYFLTDMLGVSSTLNYPWCSYINPITRSYPANRIASWEECWDQTNPGPPYRSGGAFFLKRKRVELYHSDPINTRTYFYRYAGKFACNVSSTELDTILANYQPTASTYGAQAWNKFRPVKPRADAGQFIGELRDFTSMWKFAIKRFQDLGSQYLNVQFGWKPFLNDIKKFIKLQHNVENHIRFVRKNNNKWIRRGGSLRNEVTSTTSKVGCVAYPVLETYFYPGGVRAQSDRTVITRDNIWFDAVMKYYIRGLQVDSCKSVWSSKLLQKLYGFELTPSLAWELLPFSWLQDWIVNIGDILSNLSNSMYDNLVAKYSYVMRHRQTEITYRDRQTIYRNEPICVNGRYVGLTGYQVDSYPECRAVLTVECKERERASQWGFGNEGDGGLSPRQEMILLALGISRV